MTGVKIPQVAIIYFRKIVGSSQIVKHRFKLRYATFYNDPQHNTANNLLIFPTIPADLWYFPMSALVCWMFVVFVFVYRCSLLMRNTRISKSDANTRNKISKCKCQHWRMQVIEIHRRKQWIMF
jgi:hypothetical protein